MLSLIAVLSAVAGAFYWYEYRPSVARQQCHQYADKLSTTGDNRNDKSRYDFRYKFCMQERGVIIEALEMHFKEGPEILRLCKVDHCASSL